MKSFSVLIFSITLLWAGLSFANFPGPLFAPVVGSYFEFEGNDGIESWLRTIEVIGIENINDKTYLIMRETKQTQGQDPQIREFRLRHSNWCYGLPYCGEKAVLELCDNRAWDEKLLWWEGDVGPGPGHFPNCEYEETTLSRIEAVNLSIITPAGTFSDCTKYDKFWVEIYPYTEICHWYEWVSPGIGPVQVENHCPPEDPPYEEILVEYDIPCPDDDGDLFYDLSCSQFPSDCDDTNLSINPDMMDLCENGIDEDCDGYDNLNDDDGDGFIDETCGGDDCDDTHDWVCPSCPEIPDNGVDDNCDGYIDYEPGPCFVLLIFDCSVGVEADPPA